MGDVVEMRKKMLLCSVRNCGALAPDGGTECVVHREGYRRHDGSKDLCCTVCMFAFSKGDWYRQVGEGAQCAGPHRKRRSNA